MSESWPPADDEWVVGLKCDAQDKLGGWYEAKVLKVEEHRARVHFKGWGREDGKSRWDEWIPKLDKRLCALATKSQEAVDDAGEEDDGVYEVAMLTRKRAAPNGGKGTEFRVRWRGRAGEDEWVSESRLRGDLDCGDLVDELEEKLAEREAKKAQAEKRREAQQPAVNTSAEDDAMSGLTSEQADMAQTTVSVTGCSPVDAIATLKEVHWVVDSAVDRMLRRRSTKATRQFDPSKNGDYAQKSDSNVVEGGNSNGKDPTSHDMDTAAGAPRDNRNSEGMVETEWPPAEWVEGYKCDALDSYGGWFVAKVIEVENQSRVKIHFHGGTMHTLKQLSHRIYVATEFAPNVLLTRLGGKMKVPSVRLAPLKTKSTKEAKAKAQKLQAEAEVEAEAEAEAEAERKRPTERATKKAAGKALDKSQKKAVKRKTKDTEPVSDSAAAISSAKKPRALTAFNLFMKTQLSQIKAANPEMAHREAFAQVGADWKALPADEKSSWQAKAKTMGPKMEAETQQQVKKENVPKGSSNSAKGEASNIHNDEADSQPTDSRAAAETSKYMNPKKRWKQAAAEESANAKIEERAEAQRDSEKAREQQIAEKRTLKKLAKDKEQKKIQLAKQQKETADAAIRWTKEAKALPKSVIEWVYLKRSTLKLWLGSPDFKKRVEGCMVRVCSPVNHRRAYRMGQVVDVFNYRSSYTVDGATTTQGLLVKQPKDSGGVSTSVLKLDTLSNLECEAVEIGRLLATLEHAGSSSPIDDISARHLAQQRIVYKEAIQTHLKKMKAVQDKHNNLGNRKEMTEIIKRREALAAVAEHEEYDSVPTVAPDFKPIPTLRNLKDEEIWEKLLPMMKTTTKLVPSQGESSGVSPRASSSTSKRRRKDDDDRSPSRKRGRGRRDDDRHGRGSRDRGRARDRDRSHGEDRDDRTLPKAKNFSVEAAGRAAPGALVEQGYSRERAVNSSPVPHRAAQNHLAGIDPSIPGASELVAQIQQGASPRSLMAKLQEQIEQTKALVNAQQHEMGYNRDQREPRGHASGWEQQQQQQQRPPPHMQQQPQQLPQRQHVQQPSQHMQPPLQQRMQHPMQQNPHAMQQQQQLPHFQNQQLRQQQHYQNPHQMQQPSQAHLMLQRQPQQPSALQQQQRQQQQQQQQRDELRIPATQAGVIIGRQGSTIRDLASRTGANIQLSQREEHAPGDQQRLVRLSGTPQQIAEAKQLIDELLRADKAHPPAAAAPVAVAAPSFSGPAAASNFAAAADQFLSNLNLGM